MPTKRILKHFNTWTEMLPYLDNVEREYRTYQIAYKYEIWFSDIFNAYKLYITVL